MTSPSALTLSCEFFPPRTEKAQTKLLKTQNDLLALNPAYYSVTFGAGGSTRENTCEAVKKIQPILPAAPHISCIAASKQDIQNLLKTYRQLNINRLVVLRGDRPSGLGNGTGGDFRYANELVAYIRQLYNDTFHIEVAAYPECHPESDNFASELMYFKNKIDAGANSAVTQYFYNADAYFYFMDDCAKAGINVPIVPGIMPINNYVQLARFSKACGAEIPRWLRWRLGALDGDPDALSSFGIDMITQLCQRLIEGGAPGLHFYTLNRTQPTLKIAQNLGLV
jgi:methylenetetrahydrofolate reductase (NADPH)